MKTFLRYALVAVLTLVLALAGGFAALAWWAGPLCGRQPVTSAPSPSGALRAEVAVSSCGATTPFTTAVTLRRPAAAGPAAWWEGDGARVFNATQGDSGAAANPQGGPVVTVRWLDDSTLAVGYDPRAHVSRREARVRGVRVRYASLAPPAA